MGQDHAETCPLYGGVELRIGGEPYLRPQCCGDLSDIASWCGVAEPGFREGYLAPEGHPNPHVRREASVLRFACVDEYDPFSIDTIPYFDVQREAFLAAIPYMLREVDAFADRVSRLTADAGLKVGASELVGISAATLLRRIEITMV